MKKDLRIAKKSMQTELAVLRHIHATPKISRVELAELSGLSTASITGIVNSLISLQLLAEDRGAAKGAGRKRVGLTMKSGLAYVAGIDLGTINLRICITDINGEVLASKEVPSEMSKGREDVLSRLFALVRELISSAKLDVGLLGGIGIGFSGVIDVERGVVLSYPRPGQIEQWKNMPLRTRMEQEFGVPVLLEDSVRAVAVMERLLGAGRDFSNFVYVDVGAGIGAAIFIGGCLYRGHGGSAGEFGHITVDEDGPLCCCGSRGCLEAVASGTTMIESIKVAIRRGVSSKITETTGYNFDEITIELIAAAARNNDSLSYRILSEAASHIGAAAADLVNLLNPAALVFGGAAFRAAPDLLVDRIQSTIRQRAMEKSANDVQIKTSTLDGKAGALGAARLIAMRLVEGIYFNMAGLTKPRHIPNRIDRNTG
jgi:glucokinase-like ROK family protein